MALIVRCPWTGKPLRAIEISKSPEELKPLFYCDLKHALLHSTFRRIVLRKALNIKFDGRTFSGILRELDPRLTGYITYGAFVRTLKADEKRAYQLGLPIVAAAPTHSHAAYGSTTAAASPVKSSSTKRRSGDRSMGASRSAAASSLGVGMTQRRLRKELARTVSETALNAEREAKEARGSGVRAVRSRKRADRGRGEKPRRALLRHELTELRGAGILLVEPTRTHAPITEAQVAWQHPKTNDGSATIGSPVAWRARTPKLSRPPTPATGR